MKSKRISTVRGISTALIATFLSVHSVRAQCHTWDPPIGASGLSDAAAIGMVPFNDGTGPALFVGGFFESYSRHVAKWNGVSWGPTWDLGDQYEGVFCFSVFDDGSGAKLYAGGRFHIHQGLDQRWSIAKLTASGWEIVGDGVSTGADVMDSVVYDPGNGPSLIIGGFFTNAGPGGFFNARNIARWNGTNWSPLGSAVQGGGVNARVKALAVWDSGSGPNLYAGGAFTEANGISVGGIARWDGTNWSPVGTGSEPIFASDLAVFDDGSGPALYAANNSSLWRFDGTSWTDLGAAPNSWITKLQVFDDGSGPALYAGGWFTQIGGIDAPHLARFDGLEWEPVGGGVSTLVEGMGVYDDGSGPELIVSGNFLTVGAINARRISAWRSCHAPIDSFCLGDGTLGACPCGNQGGSSSGCANSAQPTGAKLDATGSPASDTVVLTATGETPSALTIVVQASLELAGVNPFGDGLLCLGGHLVRLYTQSASSGTVVVPGPGQPSIQARSAARGDPLSPGSVRYYQTYYRDANASFCPSGGTFNVSSGLRVVW